MNSIEFNPRPRVCAFDVIAEPYGPVGMAMLWDGYVAVFAKFPDWDDYRHLNSSSGSQSVYNLIRAKLKNQISNITSVEIDMIWRIILSNDSLKF